ncbi:MAG: N-acetylmuramoyl-L-alanine amidase, partial [Verrucomicrobiota bacterium]|nr:N-acetylmuramoyl-L-alanine amidase [Verrucomicrobiota bacterium]
MLLAVKPSPRTPVWRAAAVALALLALTCVAHAASDWQVIKVGVRDYLSLDNIAKFYGLPTGVAPIGKTLRLYNGRIDLQVTLDSREAVVNGVRNWLSFPVIAKDGQFLMSRIDLAKTVEPQLRPQMIPNLAKIQTIVLDPGHGGHDKGALSTYGAEKDYTLDVARQLKPLLEAKGLKVIMTRDSDVFIPLEVRARIANSTPNCAFVSIHFNATDTNPSAAGFEIYSLTPRGSPSTQDDALALHFFNMEAGSPVDAPSLALSSCIYHSVLGHIPEFDRGIKRARFAVLRLTRVPAVLVEGGFLTERGESRLIANSEWRAKLAQSISVGVENYKALVEKRQRPMLLADYRQQLGGQLIARDATKPLSPESMLTAREMMPASNTLQAPPPGPAPQGSVGPENGEQSLDEPTADVAAAGNVATNNTVSAADLATPPAPQVNDSDHEMPPAATTPAPAGGAPPEP